MSAVRRILPVLCMVVFASTPTFAADATALLTSAQLREDLAVARTALVEAHPGTYRYATPLEFDRAFAAAARQCDRPMDARAFYRRVATAVATIRCAHTSVSLPDTLQRELDEHDPILPLAVRIISGRVFVLRDLSASSPSLVGREIVAVAGIPVARVLDTLYAATARDGDVATSSAWRNGGLRFGIALQRVLGLRAPFAVDVKDMKGRRERVTLAGGLRGALIDSVRARFPQDLPADALFESGFADDGAIATMALHRFTARDSAAQVALHRAVAHAFDSLRTRGSRALILDLRGNGGGEDELGLHLLAELVDHPFTYYDSLVINARGFSFARYVVAEDALPPGFAVPKPNGRLAGVGHPNQGTHDPAPEHFDGPLFVLVDGRSLSTTCEFLSNLTARRKAAVIGEESGGAYGGNTSGFSVAVRLPNSGVRLSIPQMTYYLAAHAAPPRRGILPSVAVVASFDDVLAGRDPVMQRALELARAAAGHTPAR